MRTLLSDGLVITMDGARRVLRADILVEGDRIAAVTPHEEGASRPEEDVDVVELHGMTVIPGLVQAHMHVTQALFRGLCDDFALMEWLREYDKERAHAAESIAVNEHKARMASEDAPPGGMTYGEYREELRRLTAEGDEEAGRRLRLSDAIVELAKQKSA